MAQSPISSASAAASADKEAKEPESGVGKEAKEPPTLSEKLESSLAAAAETPSKGAGEKPASGRRPTQSARTHIAANDDLPSIGGLIYALQQRPSRSPFLVAFVCSLVWLVLGGGAGWAMVRENIETISGFGDFIQHPVALIVAATVVVPIALFWFLALLVWRAQELRLMASAMTEVAVRLAEPDKMAEQSVASLGQTIRRQVAAMNDAISRALGRAGELEALVHNEVAALENSYGENEVRIRRLIDELSSEREALANNSERVSDTLRGVGSQVAQDISTASELVTKKLAESTSTIADSLTAKSGKITAAMTAAGTAIDGKIAERGAKLTEAIQATSQKAADAVDVKANALFQSLNTVGDKLAKDVPGLLERLDGEQKRLNTIISAANQNFSALETALAQRTTKLDTTLKERAQDITTSLAQNTSAIDTALQKRTAELAGSLNERVSAMDATLKKRTDELTGSLTQKAAIVDSALKKRTAELTGSLTEQAAIVDSALKKRTAELTGSLTERVAVMDSTLKKRTDDIKASLAERIQALDNTVKQQAASIEQSLNKNTMALSQVFAEGTNAVNRSAADMAQHSTKATENMNNQAHTLRSVSKGLLDQIHSLTQRFEQQGHSIMTAANALDSSNSKIDSILERRHTEISTLLDMVSGKAQDLDQMMRSYTGIIESSLTNVESRAKEISANLVQESTSQSRATIEEIERLRADTRTHTSKAVQELQGSFEGITQQVAHQLGALTQQFGKTTHEMRTTATQTAGEIETTRQELQRRMRDLPQETRQNTETMRKAITEQLRALDSLSAIVSEQQRQPAITAQPPAVPQSYDNSLRGNGAGPGTQLPLAGPSAQTPAYGQPRQQDFPALSHDTRETENLQSVTSSLAQRLAGGARQVVAAAQPAAATPAPAGAPPHAQGGVRIKSGPPPQQQDRAGDSWSVGDLLARASQPAHNNGMATQQQRPPAPPSGAELRLTDLARAIDHGTAADVWQRFQRGERNIFSRQLYTHDGQVAFDEISARYQRDPDFQSTVNRYIGDFERLLSDAEGNDQDPAVVQNYLTSETGRVYLVLAHASGRLN